MLKTETLEVAGLASALKAVRLPHNGKPCSHCYTNIRTTLMPQDEDSYVSYTLGTVGTVNRKDLQLMQNLQKSGDQHAKVLRGIVAWVKIEAPVYWFSELETYTVGHQRLSSSSTMHTEGKGLYGTELQRVKAEIPMGRVLTKIDYFSYQTLRRIAFQRHNHRLPEWQEFIRWIHTLPLAEELIFKGLEGKDNGDPELKTQ